ncbi:hypothetical protein LB517_10690 [Mesorhizobium sp. BR1-1-12]|uniref:hypothetical protein n=1 Tax=unclassified Mesorhizobium TaxID=325217 RepID=UPI001CCC7693|nr:MULTISPECIES: hypothetical protein [unclassified Mesorhizobium]MBZ9919121.1 hypothetical protein [Mesorhizobium sp. BR1-1-7]MBZ9970100.1 hypothetical protein [Mesorhizobium sp. BR1-1-12]
MLAPVGGQDFGDRDPRGITFPGDWFELRADVGAEFFFSACPIWFAAASALCDRSVSDEPLALDWMEVEPSSFGWSWHFVIISLIAWGVTKSARPTRMMVNLPRRASARNVTGVMRPLKKSWQASFRVSGESS